MIYMAPFWGKACNGICEDFVPARREEILTKNLHYAKLSPQASSDWVYYMQTSGASLRFWLHLVQNINHMVTCLYCSNYSIMLRRNSGLTASWCLDCLSSSTIYCLGGLSWPRGWGTWKNKQPTQSGGIPEELLNFSIMLIWILYGNIYPVNVKEILWFISILRFYSRMPRTQSTLQIRSIRNIIFGVSK